MDSDPWRRPHEERVALVLFAEDYILSVPLKPLDVSSILEWWTDTRSLYMTMGWNRYHASLITELMVQDPCWVWAVSMRLARTIKVCVPDPSDLKLRCEARAILRLIAGQCTLDFSLRLLLLSLGCGLRCLFCFVVNLVARRTGFPITYYLCDDFLGVLFD